MRQPRLWPQPSQRPYYWRSPSGVNRSKLLSATLTVKPVFFASDLMSVLLWSFVILHEQAQASKINHTARSFLLNHRPPTWASSVSRNHHLAGHILHFISLVFRIPVHSDVSTKFDYPEQPIRYIIQVARPIYSYHTSHILERACRQPLQRSPLPRTSRLCDPKGERRSAKCIGSKAQGISRHTSIQIW